jgi:3-oxoacyl-[acyl-carrier-protein] synthase-3
MPNAIITGTGGHVPDQVITNDHLRTHYGIETTPEWILKRTGIEERRFAPEGIGTADLALPATRSALESAGLEATDLDMILFASLSPDFAFPGSGCLLMDKLGLSEAGHFIPAMDIRNQCSGFLYGLGTATAMIESGVYRNILLVGAELHSGALDLTTRGRTVASLFGDGAGAVIVSATDEDRGVRGWWLGSDGQYAEVLCQKVWHMTERPFIPLNEDGWGLVSPEYMWTTMDGRLVFRNAVERMSQAVLQACTACDIKQDQIDLFFFHQANLRINQYVAKSLGIPEEKTVNNIHKYGNTTAATIPLLLAEAERDGRLRRGMKVALVAFGSGFTWGSAIVDW